MTAQSARNTSSSPLAIAGVVASLSICRYSDGCFTRAMRFRPKCSGQAVLIGGLRRVRRRRCDKPRRSARARGTGGVEQSPRRQPFSHSRVGRAFLRLKPEKGSVMSSRIIVSLAASVIVSFVCIATISTDAFAWRRGVGVGRVGGYHSGIYRGGVYRGAAYRRGVAVGVGAAAVGGAAAAGAYGAYRCGYYPYQPCY